MKKKTVIIISVVAVSLLLIVMLIRHFENQTKPYYWRTVPIEKGDVNVIVTSTGTMAADTSVDVGVQVSGIIAKILVDFNYIVKKGQVIAVLDTTFYYASKVDAEATVQRVKQALDLSKREFERTKNLFENKVTDQADYDSTYTAYQTAQGNLISAQAKLNQANINLRYCTVTAPISGIIVARNVQIGNMVIASMSSPVLFTIAYDLTKMQVQADVDEADIGLVKEGQIAKFTVDAYPDTVFTGVVTQVRLQAIMVQNVVNYVVIIEVPNPDLKLIPGLTANSNIYIKERKNVLKIPTNAFAFAPPIEYIQGNKLIPDSIKKFWTHRLRQISELKKNQIVEPNATKGYLWIKSGQDVFPVQVTKGLNDGTFTEISGDIKEDYDVAIGINQSATATAAPTTQSSPFLPKFTQPTRK